MRETAKIEKKQSSKQTRLHLIAKFSQGNNFWLQMGPSRKCRAKLKCGQKKKKWFQEQGVYMQSGFPGTERSQRKKDLCVTTEFLEQLDITVGNDGKSSLYANTFI